MSRSSHSASFKGLLLLTAALGFLGINGLFLYYLFFEINIALAALQNPVSLAFITEAVLLMVFGTFLVAKADTKRLSWGSFLGLSLIGSLAFSIPIFLLVEGVPLDDMDRSPEAA